MKKKIYVEGMSCMHCVNRVKKALEGMAGVNGVTVDLEGKFAVIEADPSPADTEIKTAIEDAGYEVKGIE
jgi:copper ion binding protein